MFRLTLLLLLYMIYSPITKADCFIGCDSINRNISTDFSKLSALYTDNKFKLIDSQGNSTAKNKIFCKTNERNQLEASFLVMNQKEKILATYQVALNPPKFNDKESGWTRSTTVPSTSEKVAVRKKLNFGLSKLLSNVSEDRRCISLTPPGVLGLLSVCFYGNDEELPPLSSGANKLVKKYMSLRMVAGFSDMNENRYGSFCEK